MEQLTNEQISDYKAVFGVIDSNGDGRISIEELDTFMRSMGKKYTETELQEMITKADADNDGTIDILEFLILMSRHCGQEVVREPVVVIGSKYCSPPTHLTHLIITMKARGKYIVEDLNGKIMFTIKPTSIVRNRHVLYDAEGWPIVTMKEKTMTAHGRWNAFKGYSKSPEDLLFCAKDSKIVKIQKKVDVFLASNRDEDICDFRIVEGSKFRQFTLQLNPKITIGAVLFGKDKFVVTVCPNIDCAFVVVLFVMIDIQFRAPQRLHTSNPEDISDMADLVTSLINLIL